MVNMIKIVPYLQIHVAYYRYPRLKQDLKLTPVRPVVNPSASILDESRFINNPAYEQTTQDLYDPGWAGRLIENRIDGWVKKDKGMIDESKENGIECAMKILHTPVRLYATGGVESYVLNLTRSLADLGHEVKVICSESDKDMGCDPRVSVETLRSWGRIANTNITPGLPLALLKENFDVMHTHLPTPWSADWSLLACLAKKKPLILTYHNDIVGSGIDRYLASLYNATALNLLLKRSARILVARPRHVSFRLKPFMDKVEFVPVGVDVQLFHPRERKPEGDIFFLSVLDAFHSYKGLDVLLGALKAVKEQIPQVILVVGGGGELLEHYRQRARELGLERNVRFEGRLTQERLLEIYNGCKLFVLPSLSAEQEGFGIVPLEAMACGRPVVVTDIVGVAEDVGRTGAGIVVKPADENALSRAIVSIIADGKSAARMGDAGRRLVEEKYSWKTVALQVERIYREAAEDGQN